MILCEIVGFDGESVGRPTGSKALRWIKQSSHRGVLSLDCRTPRLPAGTFSLSGQAYTPDQFEKRRHLDDAEWSITE